MVTSKPHRRRFASTRSYVPQQKTFKTKTPIQTIKTRDTREIRPVSSASLPLTPVAHAKLRVIVMGGAEEVGRNMTLIEYGNDIVAIDCGLQFPEEEHPGIDYIIPNISYLKGKEKNFRGFVITHGHMDHIGGLPHLSPILGNPPIYGTKLTLAITAKRQEDFLDKGKLDLREITADDTLQLGSLRVEFFRVNHNIPDSVGIVVHTPEGTVVHTGDFKFDFTPVADEVADLSKLARLGEQGVLALLSDSTNASKPGHQVSESAIGKVLEQVFKEATGRIIVGTFGSLLSRVQQVMWLAEKLGKKVVVEGYSMKTNVEIAYEAGYLKFSKKILISAQEAHRFPDDKIVIMCTGAQGEGQAALVRMAAREHRFFHIQPNDTVIFSSSVVPGNERSVQRLRDTLVREGANVVHYELMDVHAGGHAQAEDLKLLYRLVKPKYIVPIEGNTYLLHAAAKVGLELGWPKERVIVPSNGQVMEFSGGEVRILKDRVPTDYVMVDGLGVGDVSHVVLRDRQVLAEDGMFVVVVTVSAQTGELIGSPDIISRGFVYLKENKTLIEGSRQKVRDICRDYNPKDAADPLYLKNKLRDGMGQFLFHKTERRPMILPVVIEV